MHRLLIPLLLLVAGSSFAQLRAVTERGDTIYVYDNGTWSFYADGAASNLGEGLFSEQLDIARNDVVRTGRLKDGERLTSRFGFYELAYDPEVWRRVPPGTLNAEAEHALVGDNNGMFMIAIAEEGEIGTENLVKVARQHMRAVAEQPIELLELDYRTVNGVPVAYASHRVRISGMDIVWMAIYHSGPAGSLQVATWTTENLYAKKKDRMQTLLDNVFIRPEQK